MADIQSSILQSSPAWAQAFRDYASNQRSMGNIDLRISGEKQVREFVWADFLKSRPAQVLLENPPVPGTPWYTPEPVQAPYKAPEPVKDVPEPTPEPETRPEPSKAPEAIPEPTSILQEKESPTVSNPLIDMIAQELLRTGFTPEKALSAEQVTTIAEHTSQKMLDDLIARLEQEGKLTWSPQRIRMAPHLCCDDSLLIDLHYLVGAETFDLLDDDDEGDAPYGIGILLEGGHTPQRLSATYRTRAARDETFARLTACYRAWRAPMYTDEPTYD